LTGRYNKLTEARLTDTFLLSHIEGIQMKRHLTAMELLFACTLLIISQQAQAVSKWIDSDGNVNYSDIPPANVNAQPLRPFGGSATSSSSVSNTVPKSLAEQEADLKRAKQKREEDAQKDSQKAAEKETKINNCNSARENLRNLESGMRITSVDDKGERIFLDDAAKQQRITEARRVAELNCN
jgi:hypothetical protein